MRYVPTSRRTPHCNCTILSECSLSYPETIEKTISVRRGRRTAEVKPYSHPIHVVVIVPKAMNYEFCFPLGIKRRLFDCLDIGFVVEHNRSVPVIARKEIERHIDLRRTHRSYAQRSVQDIEVVAGRETAQVIVALDSRQTSAIHYDYQSIAILFKSYCFWLSWAAPWPGSSAILSANWWTWALLLPKWKFHFGYWCLYDSDVWASHGLEILIWEPSHQNRCLGRHSDNYLSHSTHYGYTIIEGIM